MDRKAVELKTCYALLEQREPALSVALLAVFLYSQPEWTVP